jgi:hypothetical protein
MKKTQHLHLYNRKTVPGSKSTKNLDHIDKVVHLGRFSTHVLQKERFITSGD